MPNEILQALPAKLKEAVRQLFVTMWLTGYMPDSWKTSRAVLLYKKGDPTILSNLRPIALTNTLYKTWTSMVTHALLWGKARNHWQRTGGISQIP